MGLVAYVVFTWALWKNGYLLLSEDIYYQLTAVWAFGFAALLFLPQRWVHYHEAPTILLRVLWCNLGVIAMAALVPHAVRVLMLVLPVFGVFYAGLHLQRPHVLLVALFSWLFYLLCALGIGAVSAADEQFESLLALGFACMLAGGLLLAWEALRLRDALREENRDLLLSVDRLNDLALKDELTGVHNRRYILDVLHRQKSLADRNGALFTLCYCDLDHFKRLNDRFGHAVGDAALKQFGKLAQSVVRNMDYVARFGGEEFVLVLVGADCEVADQVAQRLAAKTKQMWIPETPQDFVLSVSIGVTQYRSGEAVDDLLNRADRCLYEAKQNGRDRVVVDA